MNAEKVSHTFLSQGTNRDSCTHVAKRMPRGGFWPAKAELTAAKQQAQLKKSQPRSDDVCFQQSLSLGQIRAWLDRVGADSPESSAGSRHTNKLPLRVVDCVTRRVILSTSNMRYVSLSYVWDHSWQKDIDLEPNKLLPFQTPRVIEDAIQLVNALGMRYLWIDRYCVSNDREERAVVINGMDQIFQNAYLTIVADSGPSRSDDRFLYLGRSLKNEADAWTKSDGNHFLTASKWATRAWTFQELLFSPRLLFHRKDDEKFMYVSSMPDSLVSRRRGLLRVKDDEIVEQLFSKLRALSEETFHLVSWDTKTFSQCNTVEQLEHLASGGQGSASMAGSVDKRYSMMEMSNSPVLRKEQDRSSSTGSASPYPSLFSGETSMSSSSSRPNTPGSISPLGAREELIDCFGDDDHLNRLISSALVGVKMPAKQLKKKMSRTLEELARNLQRTASCKLESEISSFVKQSARHIAHQLVSRQDPKKAQLTAETLSRLSREYRQLAIGRMIREMQSPKDLTAVDAIPNVDEVEEHEEVFSFQQFRECWEQIKAFVLGGEPYQKLIEDIEQYVHYWRLQSPQTAAEDLTSANLLNECVPSIDVKIGEINDDQIEANMEYSRVDFLKDLPNVQITKSADLAPPSLSDRVKESVEWILGEPISWWPFSPRETRCASGHFRVSWTCVCGSRLYFDVTSSQVGEIQELLTCKDPCRVTGGPILPLYNSPPSVDGMPISNLAPSHAGSSSANATGFNSSSSTGSQSNLTTGCPRPITNSSSFNDGFIHWCVDEDRTMTRLLDLDTKTVCENTIIKTMLDTYSGIRGWRNWWTLSVCVDAAFIQFGLIDSKDAIAGINKTLPPKSDTEYEYDSFKPLHIFEKCLRQILRHGLIKGKICIGPGPPLFSLRQLPRKVSVRLDRKPFATGYGLYALSERSGWKLAVVYLLSLLVSAIFALCWLLRHPDDLQNAFLIFLIIVAFLSFFRPSKLIEPALKFKID